MTHDTRIEMHCCRRRRRLCRTAFAAPIITPLVDLFSTWLAAGA